jgi:hypothetical protein
MLVVQRTGLHSQVRLRSGSLICLFSSSPSTGKGSSNVFFCREYAETLRLPKNHRPTTHTRDRNINDKLCDGRFNNAGV